MSGRVSSRPAPSGPGAQGCARVRGGAGELPWGSRRGWTPLDRSTTPRQEEGREARDRAERGESRPNRAVRSPLPAALRPGPRPPPLPRHPQASAGTGGPKAASFRCPVLAPARAPRANTPEPICFLSLALHSPTLPRLPSLTTAHQSALSPRLKFPSLFSFCIVPPAPTTTSLHAARHAPFTPPPQPPAQEGALQLVCTEIQPSPWTPPLASPPPSPPPRALRGRARRARATANARSLLPHSTYPTLPLAASGLWGIRNSGGGVKVAGPHCPTPYGVRRSKLGKLGHSCRPFPGGSWWSFSGRGLGAETSSVPLSPPLHAGDAE